MYFADLNLKNLFYLPAQFVVEVYSVSEIRFKKGSLYLAIDSSGTIKTRVSGPL